MNLKITISIDDVHPEKEWKILGDQTEKWLRSLNEEFGAKFTCFIPSNYHNRYPLSENKEWIRELNSIPWIECAAHGHYHQTSDSLLFGECEFFEISTYDDASDRIDMMYDEWASVGKMPCGFRPPGWLCSQESNQAWNDQQLTEAMFHLKYVAVHYEHNRGMQWNCPVFFGHDGINLSQVKVHNENSTHTEGMIMFQSHIAGDHNDNVWNERNYQQLRLSLQHLIENYQCEFKLLKDCI